MPGEKDKCDVSDTFASSGRRVFQAHGWLLKIFRFNMGKAGKNLARESLPLFPTQTQHKQILFQEKPCNTFFNCSNLHTIRVST